MNTRATQNHATISRWMRCRTGTIADFSFVPLIFLVSAFTFHHHKTTSPLHFRFVGYSLRPPQFAWKLKCMKQSPPSHHAGMQYGARVGQESFADLTGLPGIRRHVERHINHDWRPDDVVARNAAPEAAVIRIRAIITHREITIVRN